MDPLDLGERALLAARAHRDAADGRQPRLGVLDLLEPTHPPPEEHLQPPVLDRHVRLGAVVLLREAAVVIGRRSSVVVARPTTDRAAPPPPAPGTRTPTHPPTHAPGTRSSTRAHRHTGEVSVSRWLALRRTRPNEGTNRRRRPRHKQRASRRGSRAPTRRPTDRPTDRPTCTGCAPGPSSWCSTSGGGAASGPWCPGAGATCRTCRSTPRRPPRSTCPASACARAAGMAGVSRAPESATPRDNSRSSARRTVRVGRCSGSLSLSFESSERVLFIAAARDGTRRR